MILFIPLQPENAANQSGQGCHEQNAGQYKPAKLGAQGC